MLLRLLPLPTPSSPAPPTILFTLPLPTHPYTSRNLPLPPNLLAHRSVCLQEDLDCPNVLLGEKSSWISGVVDDVTFSLPSKNVSILLIDGNILTIPLTQACTERLRMVIHEVQLSFAPPPVARSASMSSTSSTSSTSSSGSSRRSPSSLLLSILSPLLTVNTPSSSPTHASFPSLPPQPPARIHRRQARSLLVDTYRQFVLPALREILPSAYLPWAIGSLTARKMKEFTQLRDETNALLAVSGIDPSTITPMKRSRSTSTTSSFDSDSDDESISVVTPATSVFSPSSCSASPKQHGPTSPQNYLLSVPPAYSIPLMQRSRYSANLAKLSKIASRLSAIKRLQGRYEREEGKRRWLEGLERGRQGDKALRRAFSNGLVRPNSAVNADPVKRSHLWRSWTAADQERSENVAKDVHPAMMEDDESASSYEDTKDTYLPLPLQMSSRRRSAGIVTMPNLPDLSLEDSTEEITDKIIVVQHGRSTRPPLAHRDAEVNVPAAQPPRFHESLSDSDFWNRPRDVEQDQINSVSGLLFPSPEFQGWDRKMAAMAATVSKPDTAFMAWEKSLRREDETDVRVEVHGGVEIVYA